MTQAIETIRNRIDALGVSEPVIQEHGLGDYQILVQLPGVDDPARVKEIMQSTAMLEIKQSMGGPYSSEEAALQDKGGVLPPDAVLMPGKSIGSRDAKTGRKLVPDFAGCRGDGTRFADGRGEPRRKWATGGAFHSDRRRRPQVLFASPPAHVGDYLAVVLDNKVQEVAVIKEAIRDTGIINGRFTEQEAQDLSMTLRSGALPAGIKYLEERTVGPSLGADSIRSGVQAASVGMLAVLIFMLIYYRWAGVNADVALDF